MRTAALLLILAVAIVSGCTTTEPPKTTAQAGHQQPASAPTTATAPTETREQTRAIAEIEKNGGAVKRFNNALHGPVVEVDLYGKAVTNAMLVHIAVLNQLQTLDLAGTQINDDGLE